MIRSLCTNGNRMAARTSSFMTIVPTYLRTALCHNHISYRYINTSTTSSSSVTSSVVDTNTPSSSSSSVREGLPSRHIVEDEEAGDDDEASTGAFHNLPIIATSQELMVSATTKMDKLYVARKIHSDKLAQIDFTKRKVTQPAINHSKCVFHLTYHMHVLAYS